MYRGADKSLARPGRRQATETEDFDVHVPYILESNPHPFYSFRGLKNQMRIRIACGLDLRSRAGFLKNDKAAVCAVRKIKYFLIVVLPCMLTITQLLLQQNAHFYY
jgi:hypothetical protein